MRKAANTAVARSHGSAARSAMMRRKVMCGVLCTAGLLAFLCILRQEYRSMQALYLVDVDGTTDRSTTTSAGLRSAQEPPEKNTLGESSILRWYGFRECPWMTLPPELRYPRLLSGVSRDPPDTMVRCLQRLTRWQEEGEIIFVMMEGQGLAAQMSGGYHGNSDDDDLDLVAYSRRNDTLKEFYEWCEFEGFPWKKQQDLGNFGFYEQKSPELGMTKKEAFRADIARKSKPGKSTNSGTSSQAVVPGTESYCIGRWGPFEVLLPHPSGGDFRKKHGGSYWVPPVSGGKELGMRLKKYMQPGQSLHNKFHWLRVSYQGLVTIDKDGDGAISSTEFFSYCRSNPRINQKWLAAAAQDRPCDLANALVHYQHTMRVAAVATRWYDSCENNSACNLWGWWKKILTPNHAAWVKQCHAANWEAFEPFFGDGPSYSSNDTECSRTIRGAFSEN